MPCLMDKYPSLMIVCFGMQKVLNIWGKFIFVILNINLNIISFPEDNFLYVFVCSCDADIMDSLSNSYSIIAVFEFGCFA